MPRSFKFISALLPVFFLAFFSNAQEKNEKNYNLTTSISTVGVGNVNILEPYLSPYNYTGNNIEFCNQRRKYMSCKDTVFSVDNKFMLLAGDAKHPSKLNSMLFFNGSYEWGAYYKRRCFQNLNLLIGGSADAGIGGKYIARNVNNPFSLDLYADINMSFSANYKFDLNIFHRLKQGFRVEYGAETPLAGYMFVPPQGESYYEIFSLANYKDVFHFTSIHNKRAVSQYLNIDIPLRFTTVRLGVKNNLLQYKINGLVYHNYTNSVNIGCVVDLYVFGGTKNKPPKDFKRSY